MSKQYEGHEIYTKDDFTEEEIKRNNLLAFKVIVEGKKICKFCGGSGGELIALNCGKLMMKRKCNG